MSKMGNLRHIMVFPARAYLKYNGYLGIVGYNEETDELFISTKTSNQGDMAKVFTNLLSRRINLDTLKEFVKDKNISLVFEVVDPINDPHIIEYNTQHIILLDCIDRTWEFQRSFDVYNIGKELGLDVKEETYVFNNYNEFYEFYQNVEKYDYQYNDEYVEGFVIEDSAGFMVKMKSGFYQHWKKMRMLLHTMGAGRPVKLSMLVSPEENEFYAFLKTKERDELKGKSIIQLRKEYEL